MSRRVGILASSVALVVGVTTVWAAPATVVATVGPLSIPQDELDYRAGEMEQTYRQHLGHDMTGSQRLTIRRQALEFLVRQRLYRLEADRIQVPVPQTEIEAFLKHMPIFNPGGAFSERAWENARRNDPAAFRRASDLARRDLGAQRLADEHRRRFTPTDDELRRAAARALESVDLEYLALPRSAFNGRYREPTEREMLEEHRAHASDFDYPARADVHVVAFDATSSDASERSRVRARADSAITAVRAGMPLSEAANRFDASVRLLTLRDDNLPGSWRGTWAQNARIFRAAPGTFIDEPVASANGFYVVEVDSAVPRHAASLAEASPIIRKQLRQEIRDAADERQLTRLYASVRDSLSRPGYRLRIAVVETSRMKPGDPSPDELTSFYQSHLADYSHFDPATQSLVTRSLAEVRSELIQRWKTSRRDLFAHDLANRIGDAWTQGRRDRGLEEQAKLYEPGAVPYGAPLDAGAAGSVVSDTLRRRAYDRLLEVVPFNDGYAVVHAFELVEHVVPSLEAVRAPLVDRLRMQQDAAEVENARRVYEQNPDRYLTGKLIYYSRLWCPQPELIDVPMTRQELEAYYRQHLADFASPERFRVRHIQIKPSGLGEEADRSARQRAEELLVKIRGGEDFAELAGRVSDDDKTRDDGGDLGYRSAGELAPELQKAAFVLKVGQVSDVVRATDGYHILQLTEHIREQAEPLEWVYTAVGADAALKKAQAMARQQADSLSQVIRRPSQGRVIADKLHLQIEQFRHRPGDRSYPPDQVRMVERLERMKPGDMYPGSEFFLGIGSAVMWVDSIAPPHMLNWEQAVAPVLTEYRRRLTQAAVALKQAELDSLLRVGWSFDSVAALWGGAKRDARYTRHEGLPDIGATDAMDSLAFGDNGSPPLAVGALSGWVELPDVALRVRVNGRRPPEPAEIEGQIGPLRGVVVEYRLQDEIKSMKQRFPVRIVDASLRDVTLPPLPPMPEL